MRSKFSEIVPRSSLINCGHTVCHKCIPNMLTRVNANDHGKPCDCPSCREVTQVPEGKAEKLQKNYSLM